MNLVSIVGARPQFVKLAPIVSAFEPYDHIEHTIIHTGQHYDNSLSDSLFRDLELPGPDINLGVGSGPHGWQVGQMMAGIEAALVADRPDLVIVYGDTNSTLAGALAAVKLRIPIAHIEAGLRCYNMRMAEEVNRVLSDRVSNFLFCPTDTAVVNLHREGISNGVYQVGDVMKDALRSVDIVPRRGDYAIATVHRAENTDNPDRLDAIIAALEEIHRDIQVLFPMHPRTKSALGRMPSVDVIPPLPYSEMLNAVAGAQFILTDSGGLLKEAAMLGTPCIILRDEVEYPELIESGYATLAGANREKIVADSMRAERFIPDDSLYGEGFAAPRIVEIIVSHWA